MRRGMLVLAGRQLRRRAGRTVALGLAVAAAATGFTVLTASSDASRLQIVGQVQHSARTTFDILVRPNGSRLPVEQRDKLIEPGYLNDVFGGISSKQWHTIKHLSGVSVAAPIAVIGYVTPRADVFVDTTRYASRNKDTVIRIDGTWHVPGESPRAQRPQYVMSTPSAVRGSTSSSINTDQTCGPTTSGPAPPGKTVTSAGSEVTCFFTKTSRSDVVPWQSQTAGRIGTRLVYPFPFLLVAVDPTEENKLDGLSAASSPGSTHKLDASAARATRTGSTTVPVLMTPTSPVKESLDLRVARLPHATVKAVRSGRPMGSLAAMHGVRVGREQISTARAYQEMRRQLGKKYDNVGYPGDVYSYWSVSAPTYSTNANDQLIAHPTRNDLAKLWTGGSDFSVAPAGTDDTQFRTITLHAPQTSGYIDPGQIPSLVSVGTVDPTKFTGLSDVTSRVLAGFGTAPTQGATAASRRALGGGPVQPSTNIGALVEPPPMMITDISSVAGFVGGEWQPNAAAAPLSAIRVKVAGVTGVDQASRQRVQLVAQRIRATTHLDVDITVGSSTTDKTIIEPAGRFGRPQLTLRQTWVKLGVGTAILKALDKKSLVLFLLVLVVSALTVANSAIASVRSRRTEFGVLACIGWPPSALFAATVSELGIVSVGAGVLSTVLSLLLGHAAGTSISVGRAMLAVPAAILVALAAGIVPAWLAARSNPLEAVQPAVWNPRRTRPTRSVSALTRANLTRIPSRTLLAVLGLAVATIVFTLLLALAIGFQGAVVGSVLGDAVAIQARGADYAAAAATLLLAALGVANLMYLNIRDRGAELATLLAIGWEERSIARLLLVEGAAIGLLGGIAGSLTGYLGAWLLIGSLPGRVLLGALLAAATSTALALAATAVATLLLRRLPTTELLTE